MTTTAAVASIVAALTGIAAIVLALRETRRRRLLEIIDLIAEIKSAIDWRGQYASREAAQERLRT